MTHGEGWCAPQQGVCKLTLNIKDGIIEEALVEVIGCSGMTDTLGRMYSDAQCAGSTSMPAHVEMMGLIGMGNNPMVGVSVAVAVALAGVCG